MLGAAEGDSLANGEKELASLGFDVVTSTTAEVAELAKLACNTWRDVLLLIQMSWHIWAKSVEYPH